jgi:ribosome biogenesis GTPase / thiamine phosphate phosphatase
MKGRVIKSTGKWYEVELEDETVCKCRIRGKIRLDNLRTTNPIAVGDVVILDDKIDEEGNRVILDFVERKNYIVRKSTNLSKQKQILAANVDIAFLMVTLKSPQTQLAFIDRFLVSAEAFRIPTVLLFNKIDQYTDNELIEVKNVINIYESIGYKCYEISANDSNSTQFLINLITNKQVIISGHSGVGKSTLINSLDPSFNLKTGEISKAHQQGKHTTTFAEMFKLSIGSYIIDTPGIRAFGVIELDKEVISHYFPEMRSLIGGCKYHNCLHLNEPKCAVKEQIGVSIPESRYNTYLQLMYEDEDEVYRKKEI